MAVVLAPAMGWGARARVGERMSGWRQDFAGARQDFVRKWGVWGDGVFRGRRGGRTAWWADRWGAERRPRVLHTEQSSPSDGQYARVKTRRYHYSIGSIGRA